MVFSLAPETAIDPGTPAVLELGEFWATADAASRCPSHFSRVPSPPIPV